MDEKVFLHIKTSRTGEETPEAMIQLLSSLTGLIKRVFLTYKRGVPFSLEIAYFDAMIHFYIVMPKEYESLIESQILANYPKAIITKTPDYLPDILAQKTAFFDFTRVKLKAGYLLPIRTFDESKDVDLLSALLGSIAKLGREDYVLIQYVLVPPTYNWHAEGHKAMQIEVKKPDGTVTTQANPNSAVITKKLSHNGFRTSIRLLVKSNTPTAYKQVLSSFSVFNNANGNSLAWQRTYPWQKDRLLKAIETRSRKFVPRYQVLNLAELATLYHFPNTGLATIPNITWAKTILSEPPENIPVAATMTDEEKQDVNFFAKTEFKNQLTVFGIKRKDRRRHTYIIGKTGTGKSTLIANMVINDMRNGEGVAVIDPHGDLTEVIMDYVPSHRINDVVYLNPGDRNSLFHVNPLEAGGTHKDLVASGIVAIFQKIFGESWGPRLEYILRNVMVTLLEIPNSTLLMVPPLLTNPKFRARIVEQVQDPIMKNFWVNEFEKMNPKLQTDSISPILNKVGQFLSSEVIRTIVGNPKSTVDLRHIMDNKKILLFNLSQGKLGEDNSALLGAMTITKLQLAAMARVDTPEEERKDFYLYVDEFQNFATTSFIKILSEARKYRLDLILANQYTAQLPEDLRAAIFGNVGTMLTFIVGAQDSAILAKEYGERFKEEDLLALGNYQALTKLYIDGTTSSPFLAYTLPLPRSKNQNRDKVVRVSNERYGSKQKQVGEVSLTNAPDISRRTDDQKTPENTQTPEQKKPSEHAQKTVDSSDHKPAAEVKTEKPTHENDGQKTMNTQTTQQPVKPSSAPEENYNKPNQNAHSQQTAPKQDGKSPMNSQHSNKKNHKIRHHNGPKTQQNQSATQPNENKNQHPNRTPQQQEHKKSPLTPTGTFILSPKKN